jgi:uncharacterized membrane protein YGL010W
MNVRQPEPPMTATTHTAPDDAISTRRVDQLLAHYGENHQNPRNEIIHFIAIPLIALGLLGMLYALHPYVAYAFLAASMVYYARLSMVFFASMAIFSAAMLAVVLAMGAQVLPASIGIFVGAWVLQFIGHKIEGKKPSFFEDLQYLWVGPLFVLSKLFMKLGVRW